MSTEGARAGSSGRRFLFRFLVAYFGMYVVTTPMLGRFLPWTESPFRPMEAMPPILPVLLWTARDVLDVAREPVAFSGSGDKLLNWLAAGWLAAAALVLASLWVALDRRGRSDARVHAWFRVFLRFAVGTTMVHYGLVKIIPLQMPYPSLTRLMQPFGQFSPMGVLWSSVGMSPVFQCLTGIAEATAGILLFFPRTALLGTVLTLGNVMTVLTLNMTFDVPVKLLSLHLVLMSLFLLAPYAPALSRLFFLRAPAPATPEPPLGRHRTLAWGQGLLGLLLTVPMAADAVRGWYEFGGGAPKPDLYGIWNVATAVPEEGNPDPVPPPAGWQRVIVESPTQIAIQEPGGSMTFHPAYLDTVSGAITLTVSNVAFAVTPVLPDTMVLQGVWGGRDTRIVLTRLDPNRLPLTSRGFQWIQEYPFNP